MLALSVVLTLFPTAFPLLFFFFFNDTATTEIYTLSLHDALPICITMHAMTWSPAAPSGSGTPYTAASAMAGWRSRSEEHTSELQSRLHLVCRLLLEKKKMLGVLVGAAIAHVRRCDR